MVSKPRSSLEIQRLRSGPCGSSALSAFSSVSAVEWSHFGASHSKVFLIRCLYYVLIIQLHHPFIARGHDSPVPSPMVYESFDVCANAANEIVSILVAYNRTFSIRKAPYLIAYATYVSATIHIRCAARRTSITDNLDGLTTCLELLDLNQDTNSGVCNAKASLKNLRDRLGVIYLGDQNPSEPRSGSAQLPFDQYTGGASSPPSFPFGSSSSMGMFSNSRAPSGGSRYDSGSNFETDGFLRGFAGSQLSTRHSSSSNSQELGSIPYHVASNMEPDFEMSPPSAFETALLDPIGVEYGQSSMGIGGASGMYAAIGSYGQPMQYGGQTSGYSA